MAGFKAVLSPPWTNNYIFFVSPEMEDPYTTSNETDKDLFLSNDFGRQHQNGHKPPRPKRSTSALSSRSPRKEIRKPSRSTSERDQLRKFSSGLEYGIQSRYCSISSAVDMTNTSDEETTTTTEDEGFYDAQEDQHDHRGLFASIRGLKSSIEYIHTWNYRSWRFQSTLSLPDKPSHDRRSSSVMVSINLQSMILGTSVLGFPYAYMVAGIYAIPLTIIIGLMTMFTSSITKDCMYQKSRRIPNMNKRVRVSVMEICKAAWPRYGNLVMQIVIYSSLTRNVIVLILLTDLTKEIVSDNLHYDNIDQGLYTVAWTVLVLPLLFVKRVSSLAWISFIGLNLYLLGLLTMLVYFIVQFKSWSMGNLSMEFSVEGTGLAIGIMINSFAQHLSLPPLEGSMRHPASYKKTVNITFLINIIVKILFGSCAVFRFGGKTEDTITANLINQNVALPVRISVMFFTYFTLPMQSFVIFELIDQTFVPHFPIFGSKGRDNWAWILLSRALFLTLCLLVSVLIPNFGVVVSLIGSVRGATLSLMFPALFYLSLRKKKLSRVKKAFSISIIILGIAFSGLGFYASVRAMMRM